MKKALFLLLGISALLLLAHLGTAGQPPEPLIPGNGNLQEWNGQSFSTSRYNIDWGAKWPGVANAVDIDAHPFFDIVCALDGQGSRVAYYTQGMDRFQTLCELPDSIDRANRIAVCPLSEPWEPVKWTLFVSTVEGHLYELLSFQPGSASQWKQHPLLVRDIAVGWYKGCTFAIGKDGKQLWKYDDYKDQWKIYYEFADLYPDYDIGMPISVDVQDRTPWVLTSRGYVFRDVNSPWCRHAGKVGEYASDLGVSSTATNPALPPSLFALGVDVAPTAYGYPVQQNVIGRKWHTFRSGRLTQITVSPAGEPWGVNGFGEVFHGKLVGTPPSTDTWIQIKLTKIKYKDNYELFTYGEVYVKLYVNGVLLKKLPREKVKDNQTIAYNSYLLKQSLVPCRPEISFKIHAYEKDGITGKAKYYRPLVWSFIPLNYCDQGRWEVYGEDSDICIRVEYEARSSSFIDRNYVSQTPPELPPPPSGPTLPLVVYQIVSPTPD